MTFYIVWIISSLLLFSHRWFLRFNPYEESGKPKEMLSNEKTHQQILNELRSGDYSCQEKFDSSDDDNDDIKYGFLEAIGFEKRTRNMFYDMTNAQLIRYGLFLLIPGLSIFGLGLLVIFYVVFGVLFFHEYHLKGWLSNPVMKDKGENNE